MNDLADYSDPETLAEIDDLRLRSQIVSRDLFAGRHVHPRSGRTTEFAEHQRYSPGDDLRHLDWKLFGRTDRLYIRQSHRETSLRCMILLDVSRSMNFQSSASPWSKLEYAKTLSACLAWLIQRDGDACGIASLREPIPEDGQARRIVPDAVAPSQSSNQWDRVLRFLRSLPTTTDGPADAPDWETQVKLMGDLMRHRNVLFIFSDFLDLDVPQLDRVLGLLSGAQHDVRCIQIIDPQERDFSLKGPIRFVGLEQGSREVRESRTIAVTYRNLFRQLIDSIRTCCQRRGCDHHLLATTIPVRQSMRELLSG